MTLGYSLRSVGINITLQVTVCLVNKEIMSENSDVQIMYFCNIH